MSTSLPRQEKKFFDALNDIFVGAKIEGKGGYINLMNIKNKYYKEHIYGEIIRFIEKRFNTNNSNREELFARLYTFFNRYFNETGSIYFQYTPLKENIYERVYSNKEDVSLFYKTHMLYYVKSERIFNSVDLKIEDNDLIQDFHFNFDVSNLELAKNNEKKEIVFSFEKVEKKKVFLKVSYSAKGNKTKIDDILKNIKKEDSSLQINEETLSKALTTYKKQSEVDYFINKDAKKFLKEQFNLWYYQYVFGDSNNGEFNVSDFDDRRIRELQATKEIAYKIIDFISQFEDELVKVWNKPKFVRKSNYVLTLDKLKNNIDLIEKIINHKNFEKQEQEWKELGYKLDNYKKSEIIKNGNLNEEFKFLTIDTKYFEDIKYEILDLFDDLDNDLDGVLINSDNYQALNTLQNKYRGKIDLCYIDPPFNTGSDFLYKDGYQDSTWLTIMENRINLIEKFISKNGSFYLHLDENANFLGRILLKNIFGNLTNELIWNKGFRGTESKGIFQHSHDTIYFVRKSEEDFIWNNPSQPYKDIKLGRYNKIDENGKKYALVKRTRTNGEVYYGKVYPKEGGKSANDVISHIPTMASTNSQRIDEAITQKPEELLKFIIGTGIKKDSIVLDCFGGSGTSFTTSQKLGAKWLGIEMGEHFSEIIIPRLKKVLNGEQLGISEEVNWKGGGFLKYYNLEQYEEALEKIKYKEETIFIKEENKDIFSNYVFLKDEKLTKAIEIDLENGKTKIDLSKIYDDIDIGETLSNITGRKIKKIKKDSIILEGMEEIKFDNIPLELVKPLIWWK